MAPKREPIDIDQALLDPPAVFESPSALLADDRLSREQKTEILHRWRYDASELAVAEEEGMDGGEPSILREIALALETLNGYDVENTPPTKQGGA